MSRGGEVPTYPAAGGGAGWKRCVDEGWVTYLAGNNIISNWNITLYLCS